MPRQAAAHSRRNSRRSRRERHLGRQLRHAIARSPLEQVQHFLHSNPAAVPLIVLVLSIAVFGVADRRQVLLRLHADADPAAGRDRRHPRRRADAGHPDRRHRPVGRRHHGAVVGGHGPVHLPLRHAGADRDPVRLCRRRALRLDQRLSRRPHEAAALHRHARHLADHPGDQLPLFGQRDDPQPGYRGAGAAPAVLRRRTSSIGGAVFTYGVVVMVLLVAVLWYMLNHTAWGRHVYAVGDDPEAAELSGVRIKRMLSRSMRSPGLICALGRLGADRPHRLGLADLRPVRQHRVHHRRGDRRHLAVRRPRLDPRHAVRRADRRRLLSSGLRMLGTDPQWTYLLIGVLIIVAVAIDQWIRKVSG